MSSNTPCSAIRDADAYAKQQGEEDARDEALDAYVIENYGPPFDVPEFVEDALRNAPLAVIAGIARSQSNEEIGQHVNNWLTVYARQCGIRDMKEMRRD